MAKYEQYNDFKESFLVWMGDVPKHWEINKFKWIFQEKTKTLNSSLPAGSISFGNVVYKDEKNLSPDTKASYQEVLNGEYLINPLNLNFDLKSLRTALSQIDVVVSTGYIVLTDNGEFNKQYLRWLLYEFDVAHMKKLGSGVRQTINYTDIANSLFFHPELDEQVQIANFLDYETAQIDTLIEKQQTLIQLLKEKRQAVISHTVTKGLNPDAPMKDSGVEWLGVVPENWGVGRVGYYGQVLNGSTPSKANLSYWHPKEVAWLSSGEVNQYYIESPTDYISYKALKECSVTLLPVGTLVMGMIGQGKTRGTSAVTKIEATINQNLAAVIPNEKLYSNYAHLFFQAAYKELREDARGGNQAALNCEIIRDFKITIPPIDEQRIIFIEINKILDKLDSLVTKAEQAIQLMQERRTALISAAVTGKIDVRGWQVAE